jgi:hypothetical protein
VRRRSTKDPCAPTVRRLAAGPCRGAGGRTDLAAVHVAHDRRADAPLTGPGWRVLRFWEHEDLDAVADAIVGALAAAER